MKRLLGLPPLKELARLLEGIGVNPKAQEDFDLEDLPRRVAETLRELWADLPDVYLQQADQSRQEHQELFGTEKAAEETFDLAMARVAEIIRPIVPQLNEQGADAIPEILIGLGDGKVVDLSRALNLAKYALKALATIRAADAKRRGQMRGAKAKKRAKGIIQAGIEKATELLQRGETLTFEVLWTGFKIHSLEDPHEVIVKSGHLEETYRVWRDGEHLYEQRTFPPGRLKQVARSTFQRKEYYFPEIRRIHRI